MESIEIGKKSQTPQEKLELLEQSRDKTNLAPQRTPQSGKQGQTSLGYFNLEDPLCSTPHNPDQATTHQRRYWSDYSDEEEPVDKEETQQKQQ